MSAQHLEIGFVRRGYSSSGGAESYLQRLARGLCARGHSAHLFSSDDWPVEAWPYGEITRVRSRSPLQFADGMARLQPIARCDLVLSLERIWSCDVYRAGDGLHRSWLTRRAAHVRPWRRVTEKFSAKHRAILRLEEALFAERGARQVITNSEMVKREIIASYGYPAERISVVPNGVPVDAFRATDEERGRSRAKLGLTKETIAVLFAGSGWERKGLRFAIHAVEECRDERFRLLVAGKGVARDYRSGSARFLGVPDDLREVYAATDIFLLPTLYDPFSNACLEAMASGLPVITTRANGFAEIMQERVHGSVVDSPDDIAALRRELDYWSDSERRASAKPMLLARAEEFDISRNVERTLEVLYEAAKAASTSGKIRKT